MRLFIDFDGVIANFVKQYVKYYNRKFNENIDWTTVKNYWLPDVLPKLKQKDIFECLQDPAFFGTIEPMPGVVDALNHLRVWRSKYDVFVTTSIVTANAFADKAEWLTKYFPWFDFKMQLVSIHEKYILDQYNSIVIDDSTAVLEKFKESLTICYAWPHNESIKDGVDLYAKGWPEIISFMDNI